MDVNQVLQGTLSPDAATRSNAEQQLNQAAQSDFGGYLRTLVQQLVNENAAADVRQAAGIALKNTLSAKEFVRSRELQARWFQQVDDETRQTVKTTALQALSSNDLRAGTAAGQFVAEIARIELPQNRWPELMQSLVSAVSTGGDKQKQNSLATIGYICDRPDGDLSNALATHSNTILTAVVQGARKEEANADVRTAAMTALGDCLEFVRTNFENEGERNYIMQVVCEATQAEDVRIVQGAYGCLNRIMALYYDKMSFYMEKALFGLTIQGMRHEEEDVAKLAVEFWCTVCEEEVQIQEDNLQASAEGDPDQRLFFNFASIATQEVVPVLLELLNKQDEDATEDEYNIQRASYQCLCLWAQATQNIVVQPVLQYVEQNLRSDDWRKRDAAVSAFGAILDGPEEGALEPIVRQGLPVLIGMMEDSNPLVQDSTAFALGRVSECVPNAIDPAQHLQALVASLFNGLGNNPKMASSCCWALMNLAEKFAGEPGVQANAMTPYFDNSVTALVQATERNDQDASLRTAAYEVLNTFVANSANDSVRTVASLLDVILQRLEATIPLRAQVVSVEDRLTLDDIQTSLSTVTMAIIHRLDSEIKPMADRIMQVLLQVLNTLNSKSSVADSVFAAIGALSGALAEGFKPYMEAFAPYLFNALGNKDEPGLCAMAIGLVSDIVRALDVQAQPYCNEFMNHLLENLRSTQLSNQFKPAILQCFGDIAQAIGLEFELYLPIVAQVLQHATSINLEASVSYEMMDYIISLREGIMDAWAGAIMAMRSKPESLKPFLEEIFRLLHIVAQDQNRSEGLLRSAMGVVGDLAETFPGQEFANLFRQPWLTDLVKEVRSNREFSSRTIETARWAREILKRNVQGSTTQSTNITMA